MQNSKHTGGRDPNLVFAVMPTLDGNMTEPTRELWELFRPGATLGPYTFDRRKVTSYDAATARNIGTAIALDSGAGKMLMLDADMNAGPDQVLRVFSHGQPFVGGAYLKKVLTLGQEWVFNLPPGTETIEPRPDGLLPAIHAGAGFLACDLDAVALVCAHFPGQRFLSEYGHDRGREMFGLWDPLVVEENWGATGRWPRRLTDDYAFCHRVRVAGFPLFVDTVCQIGHVGLVDFLAVQQLVQELSGASAQTPRGALSSRSPVLPVSGV